MKWSESSQKNSKKRKQHPELNPAVCTEIKPEFKVNYAKQTEKEDIL